MKKRPIKWGTAAVLATVFLLGIPAVSAMQGGEPAETPVIDINMAGVEELMQLPGVGHVYAMRILDYRKEHGPFQEVAEIMNVKGIGEKTFLRIQDRIKAGKVKGSRR